MNLFLEKMCAWETADGNVGKIIKIPAMEWHNASSVSIHGRCVLNCHDKMSQMSIMPIIAGGNGLEDNTKEKYERS